MMHKLMACAAAIAVGFAGLTIGSGEAAAQGTLEPQQRGKRICPSDWVISSSTTGSGAGDVCRPRSNSSRRIYAVTNPNSCAAGYAFADGWCVEQRQSSAGSSGRDPGTVGLVLAKSNPLQLCPSGYRTSRDSKRCETIKPEAPAVRAKGAGPCNADEVEEFGAWCTSTNTTLKAGQIENITIDDFNRIFTQNGRRMPVPARQGYTTPLRSLKEAEEGAAAPTAAVSGNNAGQSAQQAAANPAQAAEQAAQCAKPKKKGLGRALGGRLGEAVGAAVDVAEGC